jgi:DNA-binding beta-propeller fold protein YncE
MNRTEERLTDALRGYADAITDDALREAALPIRSRRRVWATRLAPVAAAAAVVVIAVFALVLPSGNKVPTAVRPAGPAIVYIVGSDSSGGWMAGYNTVTHTLGHVIKLGAGDPSDVVIAPDGKMAYVLASGPSSLIPVNLATGRAQQPIVHWNDPQDLTIAPNGETVYVLNADPGFVTPVSAATGAVGRDIKVPDYAASIAVTPDSGTIYVCSQAKSNVITPINAATGTAERAIDFTAQPSGIVFAPGARTAYVAQSAPISGPAEIVPINLVTGAVGRSVPAGNGQGFVSMALAPGGRTLYAANSASDQLTPLHVATGTAGPAITVPEGTSDVVIAPDGKTAWLQEMAAAAVNGRLTPVDLGSHRVGRTLTIGTQPVGMEFTPDGKILYVAASTTIPHGTGILIPVNTATDTEGAPITLPGRPWATAISP